MDIDQFGPMHKLIDVHAMQDVLIRASLTVHMYDNESETGISCLLGSMKCTMLGP